MSRLIHYWKNFTKKQSRSLILSFLILSLLIGFSMLTLYIQIFAQQWIQEVKTQTYISVFYTENLNDFSKASLKDTLAQIEGVYKITGISAEEAYAEMKENLGESAELLSLYDENIFAPYYQIDIDLDLRQSIVDQVKKVEHVLEVKDNQEVLDVIQKVTTVTFYTTLILFVALISVTLLIVYFIINEMIKKSAQDIETYALLGGMPYFVGKPYVTYSIVFSALTCLTGSFLFKMAMLFFKEPLFKFMSFNNQIIRENQVLISVFVLVLLLSAGASIYAFKMEYKKHL